MPQTGCYPSFTSLPPAMPACTGLGSDGLHKYTCIVSVPLQYGTPDYLSAAGLLTPWHQA